MVVKIEIYDYFTNHLIRSIFCDLEFRLDQGVYKVYIYYMDNNKMKAMHDIFCIPSICIFCKTLCSDSSFKEHVFVNAHEVCFYQNKYNIFDCCNHVFGSHTLEHSDINVNIPIRNIFQWFQRNAFLDDYRTFYHDSLDIVECKNTLKIFPRDSMQIDSNGIVLVFHKCFRFYNPQFETFKIEDSVGKRIINMCKAEMHYINRLEFIAFKIQARYINSIYNIHIITRSDCSNICSDKFHIYSDVVVIL